MQLIHLSCDGSVAVVGGDAHRRGLRAAARGLVRFVLQPEGGTVAVLARTPAGPLPIGRLTWADAARYRPVVTALVAGGRLGTCPGRITGERGRPLRAVLHLAPPQSCVFGNAVGDLVLLGAQRTVTLAEQEHHQRLLAGHPGRVAVGLVPSTITTGAHAGRRGLEVRLEGRRLGELTLQMADRYAPLVDEVIAHGGRPGCEALIGRGDRGVQIDLRLPAVPAATRPELPPWFFDLPRCGPPELEAPEAEEEYGAPGSRARWLPAARLVSSAPPRGAPPAGPAGRLSGRRRSFWAGGGVAGAGRCE